VRRAEEIELRGPGLAASIYALSIGMLRYPAASSRCLPLGLPYGWDGAFGTHFWVDPKEKLAGILMIQTDNPNRELNGDFENAVMQAMWNSGLLGLLGLRWRRGRSRGCFGRLSLGWLSLNELIEQRHRTFLRRPRGCAGSGHLAHSEVQRCEALLVLHIQLGAVIR
jgi:CubicO group peptidase (beta-lactamase class C family)